MLSHQVHLLFSFFQQCLLVLKLRGVHVFVDALILSIGEASQRQESLCLLALEPGVLSSTFPFNQLHCLK